MTNHPKEESSDKRRFQIDLGPKSVAKLRFIQEQTESTSYAEAVRKAVDLYYMLLTTTDDNNLVHLVQGDETIIVPL